MIYALFLMSVSLWRLVDVTEEVKTLYLMEGESVTLQSDIDEIQKYLLIQWMFEGTRIAEASKLTQTNSTYDGPDGRFKERLKLDENACLIIKNIRTTDSGLYQLTLIRQQTSYMHLNVIVCERSSDCIKSNSINQTDDDNIDKLHQSSSDVTEEVKTISVMEGDSVTLQSDIDEIRIYLLIQWTFGGTRIAEATKLTHTNSTFDGPDGRFRDRLYLDETASLIIANTQTTDSGLYTLTLIRRETSYIRFKVTVYERSSDLDCVSSSCMVKSPIINQTEDANITEPHQTASDCVHCCGFPETVIRLVISALVAMATVAVLFFDIRTRRIELNQTEEARKHHQIHGVKLDQRYEVSRRMSSRYVC